MAVREWSSNFESIPQINSRDIVNQNVIDLRIDIESQNNAGSALNICEQFKEYYMRRILMMEDLDVNGNMQYQLAYVNQGLDDYQDKIADILIYQFYK